MAKKLTANKAKEILTDGSVHGKPLTLKQKRFFGAVSGGAPIKAQVGEEVNYKDVQDESMAETLAFLKDWYTKRATLPEFKDVSERRLKVLEKPVKTRYLDPKIMNAQGFAGSYNPTSKWLSLANPNPSFGDFPEYEKFMQYSSGSPLITHELFHRLQYEAPQLTTVVPEKIAEKIPGYPELTSPDYINLRTGKKKMTKKGASTFYPEMEAITGMLRQSESIDPLKPVTSDDVDTYIKKYDKYNKDIRMRDVDVDKVKEFHRGRLIKQLFDSLGNDPEKIANYLNSVAKNEGEDASEVPMAQKGFEKGFATRADSIAVRDRSLAVEDYFRNNPKYRKINPLKEAEKERSRQLKDLNRIINSNASLTDKQKKEDINRETKKINSFHNRRVSKIKKEEALNKNKRHPNYLKELKKAREEYNVNNEHTKHLDKKGRIVEGKAPYKDYYSELNPNQFEQREIYSNFLNLQSPLPLYDTRIVPQKISQYEGLPNTEFEGDAVQVYTYDPLAVTPFVDIPSPELQLKRIEDYGVTGTPFTTVDEAKSVLTNQINSSSTNTTPNLNIVPPKQNPNIELPNSINQKSEYSFTYTPEGDLSSQNTLYYPTYDAWKDAVDKANAEKPGYRGGMIQTSEKGDKSSAQALLQGTPKFKSGGWLDKYEYGGEAGYTDVPLNYNSAWGGQFQMGGSLPGAVGFTYARTGGIPSNGPYAKKTKASAQDGIITQDNNQTAEDERKKMMEFYKNRPSNLSGERAAENISRAKFEEGDPEALKKADYLAYSYQQGRKAPEIVYNPDLGAYEESGGNINESLEHELSHVGFYNIPNLEKLKIHPVSPKEFSRRWSFKNEGDKIVPISKGDAMYYTRPNEVYARRKGTSDFFGLDMTKPVSDDDFNRMIKLRQTLDPSVTEEQYQELIKKDPKLGEEVERLKATPGGNNILNFLNAMPDDVKKYRNIFNEVTAIPGEQAPIAQNGMSYYQHGLDWKPRSISRNGGWLDKYEVPKNQNAQYTLPGLDFKGMTNYSTDRQQVVAPIIQRVKAQEQVAQRKAKLAQQEAEDKRQYIGPAKKLTLDQQKEADKRRYNLNKDYALKNDLLFNYKTGEVAKLNDKTATGGDWGRVSTPEIVQTAAFTTPSGQDYGAGEAGANFFVNLNPVTAPITSSGRLAQLAIGQNPYGFNSNGIISNIVPTIGALGDIAGVGSIKMIPGVNQIGQDINSAIQASKESGLLSKTHKLNPLSYQRNLPKNTVWRGLGQVGYDDAVASGVLKPRTVELFGNDLYVTPRFSLAEQYGKGRGMIRGTANGPNIIAEIPNTAATFKDTYPGLIPEGSTVLPFEMTTTEQIPIDKVRFLKQHWRRGYKEIPKPTSNFESEIDWSKWNKEIPDNPQLMKEYNAIEQTTKTNGSWMKNPDGSAFQGTPEQFVQQNSENFKRAFPNVLRDETGNIQKTYHGSQDKFESFDPSIMRVGRTRGQGIYTSPIKERAASYADEGEKQLYEFYQNANKKQTIVEDFNALSQKRFDKFLKQNPKGSKDFDKKFKSFMDEEDIIFNRDLTDDDFHLNKGYDFYKVSPDEYVVPFTNYPKSAIGNNGMFDMTNPNIYKSILPIGLGLGAASQIEQKREGGIIKDDRGQWAHPGEITEIGSNQITMQGVPYPVLGISDEGDTQMMYPEQEYKFKGKKVTEYPMAQKGEKVAPIYTEDPNDPRLRAYGDSTRATESAELLLNALNEYNKNPTNKNKKAYYKVQDENYAPGSYSYTGAPTYKGGYIKPSVTALTSQNGPDGNPDWYFTYPKPVQPVIYQEPKLNRKPVAVQPISFNTQTSIPQIRIVQNPNIQLPNIPMGKYRTSYWDPEMKDWNERSFMSQQESDQFANEMSQRGYPGSYGNVTQTKKTNKKSTGGWLDKYN